jgi:hypothetical protein
MPGVPSAVVTTPPTGPEFGPSGYLPGRAAKRARKIVLRAPLGLQWLVAALVFGAIVLVAGLLFLRSSGPPTAPWVATVALADVDDGLRPLDEVDGTLFVGAGRIHVFATTRELRYCQEARRLVDADGNVWSLEGIGYGTESLDRYDDTIHDGVVYVDPTTVLPGPEPVAAEDPPASCG